MRWLILVTIFFPITASAQGPSFDCSKATTPVELAICSDAKLSKQDLELAAAYKLARQSNKISSSAQITWIKNRETSCKNNASCIYQLTQSRINELSGTNASQSPPQVRKSRALTSFEEQYLRLIARSNFSDAEEYAQLAGINPQDVGGKPWYVHILDGNSKYGTFNKLLLKYLLSRSEVNLNYVYNLPRNIHGVKHSYPSVDQLCQIYADDIRTVLSNHSIGGYDKHIPVYNYTSAMNMVSGITREFSRTLESLKGIGLNQDTLNSMLYHCIDFVYITNNADRPGFKLQNEIEAAFISILIKSGAGANYAPFFEEGKMSRHNPLWSAVEGKRLNTVRILLEAGADPKRRATTYNIQEKHRTYFNILSIIDFASTSGSRSYNLNNAKIAALLIEHGADPDEPLFVGATNDTRTFREAVLNTGEIELIKAALK